MTDSIKSVIPPRIFLWCVPRSCSSVFTKFMTYVDGAEIWFEPYVLSHLRELNWYESMIENKEVSSALKRTLNEVTSSITKKDMGNMKEFESYSYESTKAELEGEPLNTDAKFIFIKDMAFAIDGFYQYIPDKGTRHRGLVVFRLSDIIKLIQLVAIEDFFYSLWNSRFSKMTDTTKFPIPPRIFLWCVPRSCSTVFTKFMSYVDGAEVWFEPYAICWIRKVDWINSIEKKEVSDGLKKIIGEVNSMTEKDLGYKKKFESFSYESIKAELEGEPRNANAKFIFVKDMAFGIHGCYEYLPEKVPCKHVFLIRHPHRFLSSYRKHSRRLVRCSPEEEYKHGDSDLLLRGGEYTDQIFELWKYIRENIDPNPVVMDTDDMLENPEIILPKLFEQLSIPWKDSYLNFPGNKSSLENWIACYEHFDDRITAGSFDRAFDTTHFIPMEGPVPSRQEIHPDIAKFIDKFMTGYTEMRKYVIPK